MFIVTFALIIVIIINFTIKHIKTLIINSFLNLSFMLMPAIITLAAAINLIILWFILVMFSSTFFQLSVMIQALDVGNLRTDYKKIYKLQQSTRCALSEDSSTFRFGIWRKFCGVDMFY